MTAASGRSYRSKLEVLRDFLRAAREPVPKTRIIGAANLNPTSFRRYLQLCTERSLITTASGGYVTTPRATPVLEAIDGLMLQRGEVERAFRLLERHASDGPPLTRNDGQSFRHVLREAWNEIVLRPSPNRSGAIRVPTRASESTRPTVGPEAATGVLSSPASPRRPRTARRTASPTPRRSPTRRRATPAARKGRRSRR